MNTEAGLYLGKLLSCLNLSFFSEAWANYIKFLPILIIGILSSLILTPIIGYIANKYDITYKPGVKRQGRDFDNQEKAIHEGITPSLGGLAITIPTLLAIVFFFKMDSTTIPILISILVLVPVRVRATRNLLQQPVGRVCTLV